MKCPFCGTEDSEVVDSRPADEDTRIRRRRWCKAPACAKRWNTIELVEREPRVTTFPRTQDVVSASTQEDVSPDTSSCVPRTQDAVSPQGKSDTSPSVSTQPVVSGGVGGSGSESGPTRSGSPSGSDQRTDPARAWPASRWKTLFGLAWRAKYKTLHYGNTSDARACGELADLLDEMPASERQAAQERAEAMFGDFLRSESPAVVKARHPFAFFVTEFGGLRVPAAAARPDDRCDWHRKPGTDGKPSKFPAPACPRCRHFAAAGRERVSEPTPFVPITREQLAEVSAAARAARRQPREGSAKPATEG